MHIAFGLAFGGFVGYLVKEFGWKTALLGTLYGLLSCLFIIVLAEISFRLMFV